MNMKKTADRKYYLDWIRILAILMVFLLHCFHIFDEVPDLIKNDETSMVMGAVVLFLNYWIMPLFFFISGGSSYFSLLSRSNKKYIIERFQRLIVPFIFGSILFTPIIDYAVALNQEVFDGSFAAYLRYVFIRTSSAVAEGRIPFSPRIFGFFGHHLWFLAFLFIYSMLTLPVFRSRLKNGDKNNRMLNKVEFPDSVFLFGIAVLFPIIFLFTPLDPTYEGWTTFMQWGLFFVFGFYALPDKRKMHKIKQGWKYYLLTGTISFAVAAILLVRSDLTFFTGPEYSFSFALYSLSAVTASWSWVLFFIGFGSIHFNFDVPVRALLSKAALPFYIIHQPVIVVSSFFIVNWNYGIPIKLLAIIIAAFITTAGLSFGVLQSPRVIQRLMGVKPRAKENDRMDFNTIFR